MKKEKRIGMNYVHLGGWVNQHYLYVDLNVDEGYVADGFGETFEEYMEHMD